MKTPLSSLHCHGLLGLALFSSLGSALAVGPSAVPARSPVNLDSLVMQLAPGENRAVSFTNNRSAYLYTQTHRNDHPEHAWFRGLNIAGRRVFNDWILLVDGAALNPAEARVLVGADSLTRLHPEAVAENLRLFDDQDLVELTVLGTTKPTSLKLSGDQLRFTDTTDGKDWYVSTEGKADSPTDHVVVCHERNVFLMAVGPTREAAGKTLAEALANKDAWQKARRTRLEGLLNGDHYLWTSDAKLTKALRWTMLTTAELVTHQRGAGIYAGLPWFNEYWGRDSFISLCGATLVTGQFETARDILRSFAKFQDLDPHSPFYGRVPNIVKVGSLDYHTTDGTPRFILSLLEYVRYSGDRTILKELYPNIVASIEGALAHWTDRDGYLVHKDNETWMDARRSSDLASYSPRSNRANDIQALWHGQLCAGAEAARLVGDKEAAARWTQAATRVAKKFSHDFFDAHTALIADHLREDGTADRTLRPNMLFALALAGDTRETAPALRKAWETLVFPWGVATLGPTDPNFHPYHLSDGLYHKDEAYHNGTVWPWLNGIAMQRLIEAGQTEPAWRLFQNMNRLALTRGVVGGLPETLDAYPHPGENEPRLTGTFLQAWSNAEQLRIWYQYFVGIRPDLVNGEITLAPRLPKDLHALDVSVRVGAGALQTLMEEDTQGRHLSYRLTGLEARLTLDIPPYRTRSFAVMAGETLVAALRPPLLEVSLLDPSGAVRETAQLPADSERLDRQDALGRILGGLRFAVPGEAATLPVIKNAAGRRR